MKIFFFTLTQCSLLFTLKMKNIFHSNFTGLISMGFSVTFADKFIAEILLCFVHNKDRASLELVFTMGISNDIFCSCSWWWMCRHVRWNDSLTSSIFHSQCHTDESRLGSCTTHRNGWTVEPTNWVLCCVTGMQNKTCSHSFILSLSMRIHFPLSAATNTSTMRARMPTEEKKQKQYYLRIFRFKR